MTFSIAKTLKPEPNKATIRLYNLNPSHRQALSSAESVPVQVEAGYEDGVSVLYLGDLRNIQTIREGADLITTISSGDAELPRQTTRVAVTIAKGSSPQQVFTALSKALGVLPGNVAQANAAIRSEFGNVFSMGTILSGSAHDEMDRLCRSLDLEWSVQQGKLQILERKKALTTISAILFSSELRGNGMIGEPTIAIDSKDKRQVCTVRSLIVPDVFPGRIMVVQGERVKGQFRIEETQHDGDTHGLSEAWTVTSKGKRY